MKLFKPDTNYYSDPTELFNKFGRRATMREVTELDSQPRKEEYVVAVFTNGKSYRCFNFGIQNRTGEISKANGATGRIIEAYEELIYNFDPDDPPEALYIFNFKDYKELNYEYGKLKIVEG